MTQVERALREAIVEFFRQVEEEPDLEQRLVDAFQRRGAAEEYRQLMERLRER